MFGNLCFLFWTKQKKGNCCKIVQRPFKLGAARSVAVSMAAAAPFNPKSFFLFRETGEAPFSGRQWHGSWDKSVFCVGIPIVSSFFVTKYPPSLLSGFQFCQTGGGWAGDLRLQVFFEFRKTIKKNYRPPPVATVTLAPRPCRVDPLFTVWETRALTKYFSRSFSSGSYYNMRFLF